MIFSPGEKFHIVEKAVLPNCYSRNNNRSGRLFPQCGIFHQVHKPAPSACGLVTAHLPPRCVFRALGRFAAWGGGVRRGPLRGLGTWWAEIFGALFEKIVKNRSKKISALRGRCSSTDTCVCSRALKMQGSTQLTLLFRLVKFGVDLRFFRPKTTSGKLMPENG